MTADSNRISSYMELLPAIYGEDDAFLGRFLLAFEDVLTGAPGAGAAKGDGLEETIASIAQLFDPITQPGFLDALHATKESRQEFLTWLSGWVALSLKADWGEGKQRAFLAQIAQLYRRRGTAQNLEALLKIYTERIPVITDGDALPGEEKHRPHHFHVRINVNASEATPQAVLDRIGGIARALIDLQKPAHTTYTLEFITRTMQIRDGVDGTSQLGVDTTLTSFAGSPQEKGPHV